jgi:metal-responsive CopG/Arc/MetJ family transcriptional regulator
MKTKTSITLSADVLKAIDKLSGESKNRSAFIETAVRAYIAQMSRRERNMRDLEIINQRADRLNQEALDVLAYQEEVSHGDTPR